MKTAWFVKRLRVWGIAPIQKEAKKTGEKAGKKENAGEEEEEEEEDFSDDSWDADEEFRKMFPKRKTPGNVGRVLKTSLSPCKTCHLRKRDLANGRGVGSSLCDPKAPNSQST